MTGKNSIWRDIGAALAPHGLLALGGFHPETADGVPPVAGRAAASLILIAHAGPDMWRAFTAAGIDGPHPLDRWSETVLVAIAREFGAAALFPFGGPPHLPFQRWASRATGMKQSPIGPLIHPEHGLWFGFRGALALAERIELPPPSGAGHPCDDCAERPCLTSCPVGAFSDAGYDVPACAGHIAGPAGADCLDQGCLARRACPVGRDHVYAPAQARFHMTAFLAARRPASD